MDQSPYQEFLAHSTGELAGDYRPACGYKKCICPDPLENCQHTDSVRWNANRGRFECGQCNEPQEIPELLEALTPELKQPYDVIVEL